MNNKTILVIEDENPLLEVIKDKLEKNSFNVLTSRSVVDAFGTNITENKNGSINISSVQKALEYIEHLEKVDAIWLDHELLGKENGLDFAKKFKENGGKWVNIPIFVISNTSNPQLPKAYRELGVDKYYIKAEHRLDKIIEDINTSLRE